MMKRLFSIAILSAAACAASAQISITATDMPVSGDTLRHSMANPVTAAINLANTGANIAWNFASLTPISQSVDTYKTASQVNFTYGLTISPTAYGYKVADTLSSGASTTLPISITDVYTFFNKKTSPSRFIAEAFAAKIVTLPTPINYSDEDEIYYFPLTYNRYDSSTYKLSYNLFGLGSFSIAGVRKTKVDGWGTIVTPHFTTPVNVIRVRSEMTEIDSVIVTGTAIGIPRHSVTYTWLANGEHDPVLTVVTEILGTTETTITVRFHDHKRTGLLNVPGATAKAQQIVTVYPNPVKNGLVTIKVPTGWNNYLVEILDARGSLIKAIKNTGSIDVKELSAGLYILRATNGNETAWGKLQVQ